MNEDLVAVAALVAALGPACGPSVPSESEARAMFDAHRDAADAIETEVRDAIDRDALLVTFANDDPAFVEGEARRGRERARFRETTLPRIRERHDALAVRVRAERDPAGEGLLGESGSVAVVEAVAVEDGIAVGERRVGWGVYRAADGAEARSGVEVLSHVATGGGTVEVTMLFVTPGN